MNATMSQASASWRPAWYRWIRSAVGRWGKRPERQLRLCETLPLGDLRFIVLIECGPKRLLIGGTASSVALLAELPGVESAESRAGR